ncbi:predicted protein [Naegleria gruberi]|uniref:Predicted protein n=1 Tax=Naegleria gruberi TaxID=5762 RepID=D2V1G1_NAEGR|nr:uncharacterized protein NAEGRDRAFT_62567 [Naegleria gruberi]EFC49300.1 predicted protein [Naegleria gruberi]|eukprot:XP_002682044.1 predicted protein [Naegleria gruberi strain NEG-M]
MGLMRGLLLTSNVCLILMSLIYLTAHIAMMVAWFIRYSDSSYQNVRSYAISDLFLIFPDCLLMVVGMIGILVFASPKCINEKRQKQLQYFHCLASVFGVLAVVFSHLIGWAHQYSLTVIYVQLLSLMADKSMMSFLNPSLSLVFWVFLVINYIVGAVTSVKCLKEKCPDLL